MLIVEKQKKKKNYRELQSPCEYKIVQPKA